MRFAKALTILTLATLAIGSWSPLTPPASAGGGCGILAAPRDVGVFADLGATQPFITALPFVPFNFYVLGFELDGEVKGFEFQAVLDPSIFVLARNLGPGWLNVGSLDNFIVGTGGCLDGSGWFQLVNYTAGVFQPVVPGDMLVCVTAATPSSFSPAVPGYLQCDGSLVSFGAVSLGSSVYPDGCGVINATDPGPVLPVESDSWGSMKSKFGS